MSERVGFCLRRDVEPKKKTRVKSRERERVCGNETYLGLINLLQHIHSILVPLVVDVNVGSGDGSLGLVLECVGVGRSRSGDGFRRERSERGGRGGGSGGRSERGGFGLESNFGHDLKDMKEGTSGKVCCWERCWERRERECRRERGTRT